jgi:YfiH family protein
MPFQESNFICYYTFDLLLEEAGVTHGVFTRRGGVSPGPWSSLNVGGLVGDDPQRVHYNRVLSFQALDRDPRSIYDVWQVHGNKVVCTDSHRPPEEAHLKADAILTDRPQVTLFMRFADCVPILLYDPVSKVVGLAHAGWKGTIKGVVLETIKTMREVYGSKSENLLAAIGPSIGPHHYEVGSEVAVEVHRAFASDAEDLLLEDHGSVHFDLWAANRLHLEQSGVRNIETANICTACHLEDWYSHRGESGKTGRFGALIALNSF